MANRRRTEPEPQGTRRIPATTPEGRENQLIAAAVDLAENQLRDGTASAQVITHYLKLGSSREKLEQERIALENDLIQAKTEALAAHGRMENLVEDALNAMRAYSGNSSTEVPDEFDD